MVRAVDGLATHDAVVGDGVGVIGFCIGGAARVVARDVASRARARGRAVLRRGRMAGDATRLVANLVSGAGSLRRDRRLRGADCDCAGLADELRCARRAGGDLHVPRNRGTRSRTITVRRCTTRRRRRARWSSSEEVPAREPLAEADGLQHRGRHGVFARRSIAARLDVDASGSRSSHESHGPGGIALVAVRRNAVPQVGLQVATSASPPTGPWPGTISRRARPPRRAVGPRARIALERERRDPKKQRSPANSTSAIRDEHHEVAGGMAGRRAAPRRAA